MKKMILASASPRRAELLRQAGLDFEIVAPFIDESRRPGEHPLVYVERLASQKALTVHRQKGFDGLILAADTVVFAGNTLFDKPKNIEEAETHLENLSGRGHKVATAFCILNHGLVAKTAVTSSQVFFRKLTKAEIAAYAATGDPLDKAGAYGIQGLGAFLIDRVEGSLTNIIGLPLDEVLTALKAEGLKVS